MSTEVRPAPNTPLLLPNPLTGRNARIDRVLLDAGGGSDGPLLLILTGIHGNEPSGPLAVDAVAAAIRDEIVSVRGRVVGLACNPEAIRQGVRYVDEDMNRAFVMDRLADRSVDTEEVRQLRDIIPRIDDLTESWDGPRYFLDCHTVSSESLPFISVLSDTPSVQLATRVPAHAVVGGGDHLEGVSDKFLVQRGWTGFTFEAGQHAELASLEAQEAMIWTVMRRVGCIDEAPPRREERLARVLLDGPRHFRVLHQYFVKHEGQFLMKPGYFNFRRVDESEPLATDGPEKVLCPCDGRIYMPLYQRLGTVGFTIIGEI